MKGGTDTGSGQDESHVQVWEPSKKKFLKGEGVVDYSDFAKKAKMRQSINAVAKKYLGESAEPEEVEIDKEAGTGYIIPFHEYQLGAPAYTKLSFTYYEEDDTLVDGSDNPISAPEDILGHQALTNFGLQSEDPDAVYVRNENRATDYEIVRSHASYQEQVLGIVPAKKVRSKPRTKKVKDLDASDLD